MRFAPGGSPGKLLSTIGASLAAAAMMVSTSRARTLPSGCGAVAPTMPLLRILVAKVTMMPLIMVFSQRAIMYPSPPRRIPFLAATNWAKQFSPASNR